MSSGSKSLGRTSWGRLPPWAVPATARGALRPSGHGDKLPPWQGNPSGFCTSADPAREGGAENWAPSCPQHAFLPSTLLQLPATAIYTAGDPLVPKLPQITSQLRVTAPLNTRVQVPTGVCPTGTGRRVPRSPDLGCLHKVSCTCFRAAAWASQGPGNVGWSHSVMKCPCIPVVLSQDLASERLLIQMRSGITKGFIFQEAY